MARSSLVEMELDFNLLAWLWGDLSNDSKWYTAHRWVNPADPVMCDVVTVGMWRRFRYENYEALMFKVIAARKESLTSVSAHSVNLTECPLVSFRIFWAIMSPPQNVNNDLHPEKLSWNLKITQLIRKIIFQTVIFGFHVNFRGCSYSGEKVYHPLRHRRSMMFLVSRWYP